MPTVRVTGMVEALVHNGGSWQSIATLPDVCKTPTPSGPVPMPYPNISNTSTLTGGTTTVKVDGGSMAAVKGSKFAMSMGDEPGTLGGIKSSTFKQASTWLTYAFDVKLEGKNACRFSDKKFQNNENTIDAMGVIAMVVAVLVNDVKMKCGELNQYSEQLKDKSKKGKMHRDHVPAKSTLKEAAALKFKIKSGAKGLPACLAKGIDAAALSIVLPAPIHRKTLTWGQSTKDAKRDAKKGLQETAKRDLKHVQGLLKDKPCADAYKKAADQIAKITDDDYDKWFAEVKKACC
jgi:hypothetical protein